MLNKHDIDNFRQKWNRFWLLSRHGQFDLRWGIAIGFVVSSALSYIWR